MEAIAFPREKHTLHINCMHAIYALYGMPVMTTTFNTPSTISAGLRCRCPRCGEGKLFAGFLTMAKSCDRCGLDFSFADPADGPAFFVMSIVGILVVGVWAWSVVVFQPPMWLQFATVFPATGTSFPICLPFESNRRRTRTTWPSIIRPASPPATRTPSALHAKLAKLSGDAAFVSAEAISFNVAASRIDTAAVST